MTPRSTPLRIVEQGAMRLNDAAVIHEADGIACVEIDCASKYPGDIGTAGDEFFVSAAPGSLRLDETKPRDAFTRFELPEFAGWRCWAECCGRYEIRVVMVRREPSSNACQLPQAGGGGGEEGDAC